MFWSTAFNKQSCCQRRLQSAWSLLSSRTSTLVPNWMNFVWLRILISLPFWVLLPSKPIGSSSGPPLVVTKQASYQSITTAAKFNATQSAQKSQNLDRSSKTTKDSLFSNENAFLLQNHYPNEYFYVENFSQPTHTARDGLGLGLGLKVPSWAWQHELLEL